MTGSPPPGHVLAPAKLNLGLAVTGRRADGFHELRSVFVRIGLADRLEVRLRDGAGATGAPSDAESRATRAVDDVEVQGAGADSISDNSVQRALAAVRGADENGATLPALSVRLEKRIPVAAGLGGGSSDAAAAIALATEIWGLELTHKSAATIAARLGADVPFFASSSPAALVTGIGERLEALPAVVGEPGVLLVTPPERLSTAAVFAAFDALHAAVGRGTPPAPTGALLAADCVDNLADQFRAGLDAATLSASAAQMRDANDLWRAAGSLLPRLADLRIVLEFALERPVLLSGSGSTLFALYASLPEATAAASALVARRDHHLGGATIITTGLQPDHDARRFQ